MNTVYLAGGFRSGWQKDVITRHEIIDPSSKNETGMNMRAIGVWDKAAIQKSNMVFAYMERSNPSGFGLACEIGYAHALGKTVILVLEKHHEKHSDRSLEFLTCFADYVFDNFHDGLCCLNDLPEGR
jgi:nucleoside 2-deoxyribosyltransferase